MKIVKEILKDLKSKSNIERKEFYPKFFKANDGGYGQGDIFWGITVPDIRRVAKRYYKEIELDEVSELLVHPVHEVRMVGYLILTYKFERADSKEMDRIAQFYLSNLDGANNWDIVDLSCYKILGEYLVNSPEKRAVLYQLANSNELWKQRISIVSTLSLIKENEFEDTLKISKMLLNHEHDLIHKGVGWMLRELGKRDIEVLREFLDENVRSMPRTTLRYAIEKMDKGEREKYMNM